MNQERAQGEILYREPGGIEHHDLVGGGARDAARDDVRAELGDVIAGRRPGRLTDDEIVIFDSTGTALQDVAAAVTVYERALTTGRGVALELGALEMNSQRRT